MTTDSIPDLETVQTGLSGAFWCEPTGENYVFKPAYLGKQMTRAANEIQTCWLDELFEGGLEIPKKGAGKTVMTFMLTGPPGTGKSTLALELCYRLATIDSNKDEKGNVVHLRS